MTATEVITRAWQMFQDTGTTKRNPEAEMITHVNDGVIDLLRRRPQHELQADGTLLAFVPIVDGTKDSQELPGGDTVGEALAHYVAARIFEFDADDEQNAQQAAFHRSRYLEAS